MSKAHFEQLFLKFLLLSFILLINQTELNAQADASSSEKTASYYFETGIVNYYFRDGLASNLTYGGLGGGRLGLGYYRVKNNRAHHDINLFFEYGDAKYKEVPNEDFANIYRLAGSYTFFLSKHSRSKKLSLSYGGIANFDALYIVYPFLIGNNTDAYSMDLLSLGSNSGVTYYLDKSEISFFAQVGLVGWNVRPQGYNGVSPDKIISENSVTGITNNLRLNFKTAYLFQLGKQTMFELSYQWHYRKNTSTINTLNYAQHNLNFRLYLPKMTKQ